MSFLLDSEDISILTGRKTKSGQVDAMPAHQEIITFRYVAECYIRNVIPLKSPAKQKDNLRELEQLYKFIDDLPVPLHKIEPINMRQYLD